MCTDREKASASVDTGEAAAVGKAGREDRADASNTGFIGVKGYVQWKIRLHERLEGSLEFLF